MHCAPVETCLESRSEGYLPRFCKSQQSEVLPQAGVKEPTMRRNVSYSIPWLGLGMACAAASYFVPHRRLLRFLRESLRFTNYLCLMCINTLLDFSIFSGIGHVWVTSVSPPSNENLICGQPYHDLEAVCRGGGTHPFWAQGKPARETKCGPFDANSFYPLLSGSQRNPSYFELGNPGRQGACLQRNSQNSSLDQHRVRGDVGAGTLPRSSSAGTRLKRAARMREKLHSCPPRLLAGAPSPPVP